MTKLTAISLESKGSAERVMYLLRRSIDVGEICSVRIDVASGSESLSTPSRTLNLDLVSSGIDSEYRVIGVDVES